MDANEFEKNCFNGVVPEIYQGSYMPLTVEGLCSRMFFKIGFLKISQYSQENTCVGVSF